MNRQQEERYFSTLKELNELLPKYEYQNMIVSTAIALGKFNIDWLRQSLLNGVEENNLRWSEALMLNDHYTKFYFMSVKIPREISSAEAEELTNKG